MVEIYAPVYLQSALLAAVLPALLELVLVPWILRWWPWRAWEFTYECLRRALRQAALNTRVVELVGGQRR